jgi:hypothetical protein
MTMMNPDLLYFDVLISNFQNTTISNRPAQYQESREQQYLNKPDDYTLSVVRWTADTTSLPVWRCSIQKDAPDPNLSIYSITLTYLGIPYQVYLNYEPQSKATPVPQAPNKIGGLQSNMNLYYDVYSYQYVVHLFNLTFKRAFSLLPPAIQAVTFAPTFIYNPDNKTVSLYCDENYYSNTNNISPQITIFFNPATAGLFSSFPYYINKFADKFGQNFQMITDIFGLNNTSPFPPTSIQGDNVYQYNALVIYQEYSTIAQWNPVVSIVITSTTLPVAPTCVSGIIQASDVNGITQNLSNGLQNNAVFPIITDYATDTSLSGFKPFVYYSPSSEYRRIELIGGTALTNIDVSIFWKGRDGQMNAFILSGGSTITVKLLFEKNKP